jgi:hypothetical protein
MKSPIVSILGASVLVCALALAPHAHAQLGTGPWTSFSPSYTTQNEGCGTNSGLVFQLTCSTTHSQDSSYQRSERRYEDQTHATSQFQGSVVVNSLGGTKICLKQTFQDGTGPWNMIAVDKSGYLYDAEESGQPQLASYTVGSSATINTIVYDSDHVEVYINGSWVEVVENGVAPLYDKFGTYRTDSGYGPIKATWSGIKFWYK